MELAPQAEYDKWQANPSEEVALPLVLGSVFDKGGSCHWVTERSYASEEMLVCAEEMYRQQFPTLFNELTALSVLRARSPKVLEDPEETMKHYYRGATIALLALEASLPGVALADVTPQYSEFMAELDQIDLESWMLSMRASTAKQTEQLRGFIEIGYGWLTEPKYTKTAMHIGAQHCYILMAHSRACVSREQEIAWMMRDAEVLQDQPHDWLTG